MQLEQEIWGSIEDHQVTKYIITDPLSGFQVDIIDFGATLVRVIMPDRQGELADINFGQNDPEKYLTAYFGAMIGRVANRIRNAKFDLEGVRYHLFPNNANKHNLHGGERGFNRHWWECLKTDCNEDCAQLVFEYISSDGEEGYPGTLTTQLTYTISPMKIQWEFEACTDKTTLVNLTNHAFWNLDGLEPTIDDLEFQLNATTFFPADENNMAYGDIDTVFDKPLDCHSPKTFGELFAEWGNIDHNFFLDQMPDDQKVDGLNYAATVYSPNTGREMKIYTTEPCLQVYTGNTMDKLEAFGHPCKVHNAIVLEAQKAQNAINMAEFASSVILNPGEKYYQKTRHEFAIRE